MFEDLILFSNYEIMTLLPTKNILLLRENIFTRKKKNFVMMNYIENMYL